MYLYFTSFPVAGSNPGKLTVVMSSSPLVCESVSQSFIFHKLIHSFEEWSGILQSAPLCGFVWCCFSWLGWVDWDCGVLHPQRCLLITSYWRTHYHTTYTSDVYYDHLVNAVSVSFLNYKVTIFPFPYAVLWNWVTKYNPQSKAGVPEVKF